MFLLNRTRIPRVCLYNNTIVYMLVLKPLILPIDYLKTKIANFTNH